MANTNPFDIITDKIEKLENHILEIKKALEIKEDMTSFSYAKYIKIDEASVITGYKKNYIYEMIRREAIPYIKMGRSIRFDPEELKKWMVSGRSNIMNLAVKSLNKDDR